MVPTRKSLASESFSSRRPCRRQVVNRFWKARVAYFVTSCVSFREVQSLSKLWVRLPDLHRVRPHYVDSTASRPICEVKLRQAGLVVWFVRTCEVLVLYFISFRE